MLIRFLVFVGSALVLLLGLLAPWTKTPAIVSLSFGLAALGVSVLMRAGQISFGHALYACVSGYAVAFLARAWPQLDALTLIVAGTFASLCVGAIVGLFVVRYRGIFFGMLNLAVCMVLYSLIGKLYTWTGGTDGLRIVRPHLLGIELDRGHFETALLVISLLLSIGLGWLVQRYFRSASGEAMAGLKTNETRLEYLGLSARRILWQGYMLSVALVGLSGALFALIQGLVTPDMGSWLRSGEYVFIAILGGAGHAFGAFVGALVFELVKLFAGAYLTGVWQMLLGGTLIAVILAAPEGIVGLMWRRSTTRVQPANKESRWNRWFARKA
ncbi:branched-chain amino acid ABC transporter permease [Variovorax sp. E3]|uniref:branched-chain amino acid ABC transporter permease n=1 Tax=Variovorax sp. E3 TaxID=1914993 RepID=UPI0018DB9E56|nr:branched-chain amino acid ABC transporter permease [Variovorax sp. E3]